MTDRDLWHFLSERTKRGLTLTWVALFVLSLLMQTMSLAAAEPVLAVDEEQFPELGIVKTADHESAVVAGDQIGFTVTIQNNGVDTAFDLSVIDELPGGFYWTIASQSGGWGISIELLPEVIGNDRFTLHFGPASLAPGAEATVHIVSGTDFGDCGLAPNTAFLSQGTGEGLTPVDDDSAAEEVRCPEIAFAKTSNDEDGIVEAGQIVTFTILAGVAEGRLTDAVITDTLPAGQTYVDGSQSSSPAEDSFAVSPDGRRLTWRYASLTDGDSAATIAYDVTIDANAEGGLTNVVELCVSKAHCQSSDETVELNPDDDDSPAFVPPVPLELTPPPTDALAPSTPASNPGFALMLILLAIAGFALTIGFLTPVPERARRRDRRG